MRKITLFLVTLLLCAIATTCSAFELDRTKWISYANVNNIEASYNAKSISKNGDVARVWLCYHYKANDSYRLICKEYTKNSNLTKIVKILDYYSDGTFKRGSTSVVNNVAMGTNEDTIVRNLW